VSVHIQTLPPSSKDASTVLALAALAAAAVAAGPAQPTSPAPEVDDAAAIEETLRIRSLMHAEAHRARIWLWTAGYGALTLGQAIPAAITDDRGTRADLIAGAATSAVGLIGVLVLPPEVIGSSEELDRELSASAGGDPRARLARARALLERAAADEAFARSPLMHVACAAVNLAAGLALGLGYKRWVSGAITAASGIAVGELQILTTPRTLLHSKPPAAAAEPSMRAAFAPWIGSGGAGLRLVAQF
jgi:hypothetical protein